MELATIKMDVPKIDASFPVVKVFCGLGTNLIKKYLPYPFGTVDWDKFNLGYIDQNLRPLQKCLLWTG
jgi:hypothetical protein